MTPETRSRLFNYFAENHNLSLLESDFHEIELIIERPYSPEVARRLLKIRDKLSPYIFDKSEWPRSVWTELLLIANPNESGEGEKWWAEMEAIAKEGEDA